jgi:MFS family permease
MNSRWSFVLPLAVAQLVSWGSLYYAFAVIAEPMGTEMGWSKPEVTGALSAGLAATGFASLIAGRLIDTHGGRVLMTIGSIGAAILLLVWSQVRELWQLYAIWIAMGVIFSTVLYEPIFAVMTRELKSDYRLGINLITLLGGLASTAFIPLTHWLEEWSGWRQALFVIAGLQVPFGILIHWFTLKNSGNEVASVRAPKLRGRVGEAMKLPVF